MFLSNLANLYASIGQLDRAVEIQRKVLGIDQALLPPDDRTYALHRFNLGIFLAKQGQRTEAFKVVGGASTILANDLHPGSHKFAWLYGNAATALLLTGHFKEAETSAVFALETIRKTLGEDSPSFAAALQQLGWVYIRRGKYLQAVVALRGAREIIRTRLPAEHPQQGETLRDLFVALAAQGHEQEAFDVLKEFHDIELARLDPSLRLGADADRLQFLSALQQDIAIAMSFVLQFRQHDAAAIRWLYDLLLRRKGLSAETAIGQRESILAGRYPACRDQLERLSALRAKAARMMLDRSYDLKLDEHKQQLDALQMETNEIERQLSRTIPETGLRQRLLEASTGSVAAALPAETLLIEFVRFEEFRFAVNENKGEARWGPASYAPFALEAGKPESLRLVTLGRAGPIDAEIAGQAAWLTGEDPSRGSTESEPRLAFADVLDGISALVRGRRNSTARKRGQALRALILDPVWLPGMASKRLLIAPDGPLSWLSFECLFDEAGPRRRPRRGQPRRHGRTVPA